MVARRATHLIAGTTFSGRRGLTHAEPSGASALAASMTAGVLSTLISAWFPEGKRPSLPVTGGESIKLLGRSVTLVSRSFCRAREFYQRHDDPAVGRSPDRVR
jgi:hypothetical protein